MAALLTQPGTTRRVRLVAGLQPTQYLADMAKAQLLRERASTARGAQRAELSQHLSWLIHRIRLGRIDSEAKERAAALGLKLTTTD